MDETRVANVVSAGAAAEIVELRAAANADWKRQEEKFGASHTVNPTILAAQRMSESILQMEGDVYAATVSPIEMAYRL